LRWSCGRTVLLRVFRISDSDELLLTHAFTLCKLKRLRKGGQMNRKDWTLMTIALAKGSPLSPIQLQKSLFILGEQCKKDIGGNFYKFIPYNYGPFNPDIYSDAESLVVEELVRIEKAPDKQWAEYSITTEGKTRASELKSKASEKTTRAIKYLESVVRWVKTVTFGELIRTIYKFYPKFKKNSVFEE